MKQVRETKAGRSISAYVIVKAGMQVATVHSHFSDSGRVMVDIWENGVPLQQATGRDETSTMAGLVIDGHQLYDHCSKDADLEQHLARAIAKLRASTEPGTEYTYFAAVGAQPANYVTISRSSGLEVKRRDGQWYHHTGAPCLADDRVGAPTSVFYRPGLRRLEYIGYEVWRVL